MEDEYPERPECDFSKPLDQRVREAEALQYELFPDEQEEKEKRIVRRLARLLKQ